MVVKKNAGTIKTKKTAKKAVKATGTKTKAKTTSRIEKVTSEEFFRKVQERSYEIFMEQGYGHGNDRGHWFVAEKELSKKFKVV